MLYNTGNSVTLPVACSNGSVIYSYVWNFWDGSSTATVAPQVTKEINIGGQPGTGVLDYTCTPVALDGQHVVLSGTLLANNPPTILPGAAISVNDAYYPYTTVVSLTALDLDGDTFSFAWYEGASYLSAGTLAAAGTLNGTWVGNGTQVTVARPTWQNTLATTVANDRLLTCYVVDDRGGTSSLDFSLRGAPTPPPSASISAGQLGPFFDASALPVAYIGAGQTFDFTVFVNPVPNSTVSFWWSFAGSNGWTEGPVNTGGVTTVLANNGYQNTVQRDISSEVILNGNSKSATAEVTVTAGNIATGQTTAVSLSYEIVLLNNAPPSGVTVTRSVGGTPVTGPVPLGSLILFAAAGTDPAAELLTYQWAFSQPFAPAVLYSYGPQFVYDTGGYSGTNQVVQGQLTVVDRLGSEITVALPVTTFS